MDPTRMLLVEGTDDEHVVYGLLAKNQFQPHFDVVDEKSDGELLADLPTRLKSNVKQLGILLDADGDIGRRWARILTILSTAGYAQLPAAPDPEGTIIEPSTEFLPRLGVWLMPDNVRPGALEDFMAGLVPSDDPLWGRALQVVGQIPEVERRFKPQHRIKAEVRTWLAWQKRPGLPMGSAIGMGFFRNTNPLVIRFLGWLARLYA